MCTCAVCCAIYPGWLRHIPPRLLGMPCSAVVRDCCKYYSILHVLCCCCFVVGSRCWRRMCAWGRHCAAPCVRASAVLSGCAMCVGLCGGVVVCVVACRCGRVRVFAVVIKAFRWCQVCWLCLLIEIYWGRRGPRDHLGGSWVCLKLRHN